MPSINNILDDQKYNLLCLGNKSFELFSKSRVMNFSLTIFVFALFIDIFLSRQLRLDQ